MFTRIHGERFVETAFVLQKGFFMIYVGIDVASEKHDVCIMSNEGEIFGKIFQIQNTKDEYKKLLSKINEAKKFFRDSNVCIGIESTGVYSSTILNYFLNIEQIEVIFINPVLTNMFQLSQSVHYAKTDTIDAEGICNYLQDKRKKLLTYTPPSYHSLQLKSLYREMVKLNKLINQTKNRLNGIIHTVFPEFLKIFPRINGKGVYSLLIEYPLPSSYKGKQLNTIYDFAYRNFKGHIKKESIEQLFAYAKNSIGVFNDLDKILIKQLTSLIKIYEDQKKELIEEMTNIVKKKFPNILTIPGIGGNTAAGIIGEIGDISNFHNADSLLAFAGLNPLVYQSGKYEAQHTRISKKGSSYLRNALTMIAQVIIKHDETFKQYYTKKRNEGKKYLTSISHVRKKLTRVIYSVLKNNVKYKSLNN